MNKVANLALSPLAVPDAAGDWCLNELRWAVLHASLQARTSHTGLSRTAQVDLAGFRTLRIEGPQPISSKVSTAGFDCGVEALNRLLREGQGATGEPLRQLETYVFVSDNSVIAFYAARPVMALRAAVPDGPPLPLKLISGLGVDLSRRGNGLGKHLVSALVQHAIAAPAKPQPLAVIGFAIDDYAKRLFHHCATRPMGDVLHPHGVIMTLADMAAAANEELA